MTPPRSPVPPTAAPRGGRPHPIRAAASVLLLVAAGLAAAYGVSEGVDPVYGSARERYRQAVAAGPAVEAVRLGHSHGWAITFEPLGLRGANLTNPGNDYYETLHVLRSIRPHLSNLEYVFVPVSLFVSDNSTDPVRRDVRKEAYVTTGNYTPVAGDHAVVFQALIAPVVRADNWEGVAQQAYGLLKRWKREPGAHSAARDVRAPERRMPVMSERALQRAGPERMAIHRRWEQHALNQNERLCEETRQALREIARLSAPAHLVLFTPPYPSSYLRDYDTAEGCQLDRFAAELAAASPGVSYFDDRVMGPFTDDSGLFRDGDHVNRDGARVYSAALAERLGLR
jgi:hypothetical protein